MVRTQVVMKRVWLDELPMEVWSGWNSYLAFERGVCRVLAVYDPETRDEW